jgi:PAS domain S-box-containing protein
MEDKDGFLWLGTDVGLWRYDGYSFKDFSFIVPERTDSGLYQDREGIIWIGTQSGLISFDPSTRKKITYTHDPAERGSISAHVFQWKKNVFCEDAKDRLWIATDDGLNLFDRATKSFSSYTRENSGLVDDYVTAILPSHEGFLWIATLNGLQLFDPNARQVVRYFPGAPPNMYSLCEDSEQNLWIGTYLEGLCRLNPVTGKLTRYRHDPGNPHSLSSNVISCVLASSHDPDAIWVATDGSGLNLLNARNGSVTRFSDDPKHPSKGGISGNSLKQVIQDRMGAFYIVDEFGFLNRVDPGRHPFTTLGFRAADPGSLLKASNYSVWRDRDGAVWVYAQYAGLSRYIASSESFLNVQNVPQNLKFGMCADSQGTLWLVGNGYIARFDPRVGRIIATIPVGALIGNGLCDKKHPDILWFESFDSGLVKVSTGTRKVQHFLTDASAPSSRGARQTRILSFNDDGTIWLTAFGIGLQLFDTRKELVVASFAPPGKCYDNPSGIYRDSRGRYWVSFQNGGPSLFDPATGVFTGFETVAGQAWPARGSTGMLEDSQGALWISGNGSGEIVKFNPDKKEVILYSQADGVAAGTSTISSSFPAIAADGSFWFPGEEGVTRFLPDQIAENQYLPPVFLTDLTQNGVPMDTKSSIEHLDRIILPADRNYFEFQAVALNYRVSEKNRYQYRLLGRDEKWYDAGTRRNAQFSSLAEGMYILEVRGANNDGVWNDHPARLEVYVEPRIPPGTHVLALKDIQKGKRARFRRDQNALIFEAAPLDFSIVEKRNYRYKLEGFDTQWNTVEASRYISYEKVPSGRYRFLVSNSETRQTWALPVVVYPPFYRSFWFIGLCCLLLLGAVGAFYREHIAHLKQEQAEALQYQRAKQQEALRHLEEEKRLEQERGKALEEKLKATSDREMALEAQRESEARQQDLLATMTEGFIILDGEGRLLYANPRFCTMLGYDLEEIGGRSPMSWLDAENEQVLREKMDRYREGESTPFELGWTSREGGKVRTLVSTKAVLEPDGKVKESFSVITDITELKKNEEMLQRSKQELTEEKENLDQMNSALNVLLKKREEEIAEVEQRLRLNLEKQVIPYLKKMQKIATDDQQKTYLDIIASNVSDIKSDFSQRLGIRYAELTNMEMQVADLIREGMGAKQIAAFIGISQLTVNVHSANIRKKLGLTGKKIGLRKYLAKPAWERAPT